MAALDLVVLLAGDAGVAPALQRHPAVLHFDAHLLPRQPGKLGRDDQRIGGFAEVDGRRPALRGGRGQPLQPVLNREQVAERIPACEGHGSDGSTRAGRAGRAGGRDGQVGRVGQVGASSA